MTRTALGNITTMFVKQEDVSCTQFAVILTQMALYRDNRLRTICYNIWMSFHMYNTQTLMAFNSDEQCVG